MSEYLSALRRDLFDGKLSSYEYDCIVKSTLRDALNTQSITYPEWSHLYYEFIG